MQHSQQDVSKASFELAQVIANAAFDKKALDIQALNVSKLVSYADFFVVCSGLNEQQVKSIQRNVQKNLDEKGLEPITIEGDDFNRWVFMDYGEVVLHILIEPLRGLYELERLWADAQPVDLDLPEAPLYFDDDDDLLWDDD